MKENKKISKRNAKGITLIALIITIIVLLILAGVSIATITGDNGLFTQADNAKIQQSHGAVREGISLAYNEWQIELNIANTTEIASTEAVRIQGEEEKASATTTVETDFLAWLVTKGYAESDGKLNVEKLTGAKQALGNGTDNDIYKIELQEGKYIVNYIGTDGTSQELWDVAKQEEKKQSLGKLADVVKVGDYVNYAPTYTNTSTVSEGLGNGWRVAYVENGVVTLISEGVPISADLSNPFDSNTSTIEFDYTEINKLYDGSVGNNIEVLDLEDIQKLCSQASYNLVHTEANTGYPYYVYEEYEFDSDNLNIMNIGANYLLNTVGSDGYGKEHYFYKAFYRNSFSTEEYGGNIGVRLVVDLRADLDYYGGTGTQGEPYQIY